MKLVADKLCGERAGQVIFSDVSFHLNNGEALVITGSNGSGKSTLLRVVAGFLPPAAGSLTLKDIAGDDQNTPPHEFMHYLGHLNALKLPLSVEENLLFWQQYCGDPLLGVEDALSAVALRGIEKLPAAYLSAGQQRRVSIAKLLVSHKPVWIVDEPTAALDKASENQFAELIENHLDKDGIVLAATHQALGVKSGDNIKYLNLDDLPTNIHHNSEYRL